MTAAVAVGQRCRRNPGFSLIELLVAMAIGLVVTLAITSVMVRSEGIKRTSSSINDVSQTGSYSAYVLDRAIRSAGSGYSQSRNTVYGCLLDVSQGGTHILPMPAALPSTSAFSRVTSTAFPIRLAPVIIGKNLADTTATPVQVRGDVLMVMGGTGGVGESPQEVRPGSVTATAVQLQNALGYGTGDLVLLADPAATGCMVQQVAARTRNISTQDLPFGGTYFSATGTNVSLSSFGGSTVAMQIGNEANLPQFQLYGVGANNTLFSMDLIRPVASGATPDVAIADGVVEMRALYGLDITNPPDGIVDTWKDPADTNWTSAVLTDGSGASNAKLRQIVAIRLGFILRTSLQERATDYQLPTGTALTLFPDLGSLSQSRTLVGSELNYRYRTTELTIPLRNVLIPPPP